MAQWTDVADVEHFPPGGLKVVDLDGTSVAVFNLDGAFYAIEDQCTHDGGTLSGGAVEGREIVCPRHGARFDIPTGAVTAAPAYEDLHAFPVRVREGWVQVRDDRYD